MPGMFIGAALLMAGIVIGFSLEAFVGVSKPSSLWEIATALGTVATALGAVWLGLRDGRRLARDRGNRERFAAMLLWPKLRGLLNAIDTFQQETYLHKNLQQDMQQELDDAFSYVEDNSQPTLELMSQLPPVLAEGGAFVIANLHHALRHIRQIRDRLPDLPPKTFNAKNKAVVSALGDARTGIQTLIRHSKLTLDLYNPSATDDLVR